MRQFGLQFCDIIVHGDLRSLRGDAVGLSSVFQHLFIYYFIFIIFKDTVSTNMEQQASDEFLWN